MRKAYVWWSDTKNLTAVTYLRTHRDDWTTNVRRLAMHINGAQNVLDIGTGDGHTAAQLYGRIARPKRVDLVERDAHGLVTAEQRLSEIGVSLGDTKVQTIDRYLLKTAKTWDCIVAVHSNYYFSESLEGDNKILRDLVERLEPGGALVFMSGSKAGAYYTISPRNTFHTNVTAESIAERGKALGLDTTFEQLKARWYVGDVWDSLAGRHEVHAFFTESREEPTKKNLAKLLKRIEREQQDGWIDFKDAIVKLHKT